MLEANVGLDTARGNTGRGNLGRGQDLLGQCPEVRAQHAVVRRQFKQAPSFRTYRFHQPVRHPVPPAGPPSGNRRLVLAALDQERTGFSLHPGYGPDSSTATENLLDKIAVLVPVGLAIGWAAASSPYE